MKTLLITGSNRGIGLEFCNQYANDGWRVLACCRDPSNADALNRLATRYPDLVKLHALDVTNHAQIEQLAQSLSGETIDLLINDAGIYPAADKLGFGHTDYAEWMTAFNINTMAPLKMVEAFIEQIARSNLKRIVTITSQMGSITAHEVGIIKSRYHSVVSIAHLSSFVSDAENAFSREHTQWAARRDH